MLIKLTKLHEVINKVSALLPRNLLIHSLTNFTGL